MADIIEIIQSTATVVEVAGATGPQGPQGATGATGATGAQGPAGTGIGTLTTQGDTLYQGASAAQRLPIGTAGQILKVNSGGTAPEWGAAPAAGVSSVNGETGAVTISTFSFGFGGSGLVPQASGGDAYKFLKGDGTWADTPDFVSTSDVETDYFDRGGDNAATRPGTGGQKRYQIVLSNDTRLTDARQMLWSSPPPTSPTNNTSGRALGSMSYDGSYLYILVQEVGGQSVRWARTPMAINW